MKFGHVVIPSSEDNLMKIIQIEREISYKINVGNYESIMPTLRMVATLEEGEDVLQARRDLDSIIEKEWWGIHNRDVALVNTRRGVKSVT